MQPSRRARGRLASIVRLAGPRTGGIGPDLTKDGRRQRTEAGGGQWAVKKRADLTAVCPLQRAAVCRLIRLDARRCQLTARAVR